MAAPTPPQACGNPACPSSSPASSSTEPSAAALLLCSRCRTVRYCSQACQAADWATHKQGCQRPNYVIKFHLSPDDIADPPVVRTLSCPSHASFLALHRAAQVAFGWSGTHSFDFAVKDPGFDLGENPLLLAIRQSMNMTGKPAGSMANDESMPREYLLRVTEPGGEGFPGGIDRMHEGRRRHPRTVEKRSDKFKLWQLFDNAEYREEEIIYVYDFGDNWEHRLTIEGRAEATQGFRVLSGTGHPVAEDVGGVRGWQELKAAYRTSQPTREQREKKEWFEKVASNGDPQGLAGDRIHAWDMDEVNRELQRIMGVPS